VPELPEVETTARGLRTYLVGQTLLDVTSVDWPRMLPNSTAETMGEALRGRTVQAVDRRGKLLLLRFNDEVSVAIHRKMSGNLLWAPSDSPVAPHTHLVLRFGAGDVRFVDPRKFGRVYLFWDQAALDAYLDERLGPEPLTDLDAATLAARLQGRRGRIKSLLLDQAFVAGVGNLYADEALWEARIHPLRRGDSLSKAEVTRLAESIRLVLERGIERRGTSFSQYLDAEGLPGENQEHLQAYGRGPSVGHAAQPCFRCERPMARLTIGQRSSHYCPYCQKPPRD
jgi:formamidopyrimidine-DNA glycosylase